ncbi:MAG: hypothetical protein VW498_02050 [Candidatus Thalassarchaeaceae archaeon]
MADGGEGAAPAEGGGETAAVEAPAGVPAKFFDAESGSVNYEAWGKSYGELEGKIRTQKSELTQSLRNEWDAERVANRPETPNDYEVRVPEGFELPDDVEWDVQEDDPMLNWWKDFVYEQGGNQEMFDQGLAMYLTAQTAMLPDIAAEMEALGEYGQSRVERVQLWAQQNLSEENNEGLIGLMSSAAGIKVMEEMMEKMGEAPFSPQDTTYAGGDLVTMDMIIAKKQDDRYWNPLTRDAEYIREVDALVERLARQEDAGIK